jgi:hypothetical protein
VEVRESATGLGQCEELCQVDRARDSVDVLVGKFKMSEEIGFDFNGAILCEFETNGGPSISLLEFFFDREEKVVGFLLVDIELAVSGDPGGPGTLDFHAWENLGDEVADQFGKKDELPWVRAFPREWNQAGNAAGNLDEGVAGGFLVAGFRVENNKVDRFIEKLGKGVTGVYGEWGKDGENIALELFASPGDLGFVQLLNRAEVNALLGKGGEECFVKELVLVGNHAEDPGADGGEDFWGAETIGPVNITSVVDELFESGDADFEELVQVRTDDGEEFEPFEQRLGWILSLFENALIKLQPTKLTI